MKPSIRAVLMAAVSSGSISNVTINVADDGELVSLVTLFVVEGADFMSDSVMEHTTNYRHAQVTMFENGTSLSVSIIARSTTLPVGEIRPIADYFAEQAELHGRARDSYMECPF